MTLNSYLKWPGQIARGSIIGAILFATACTAGPPVQEMSDARQAITAAREAGASNAAPTELRAAEDYLDSALRNLTRKEYGQAREDAREAKNQAVNALATTERAVQDNPRP